MQNYQLSNVLGEGSYGKVFSATDTRTGMKIALKEMKLSESEYGVPAHALREAALLRACRHEHIVGLYDVVLAPQCSVNFALELCDGTLDQRISAQLCKQKEFEWMQQILEALDFLHTRRVIHRDLKPSNILLLNDKVKLADFGMARQLSAAMTRCVVTVCYRAPEIALGDRSYGTGVDIWSAGCILYEMLNVHRLFRSEHEVELLLTIFRILGTPNANRWPQALQLPHWIPFPSFPGVEIPDESVRAMVVLDPGQRPSARAMLDTWAKAAPAARVLGKRLAEGLEACHKRVRND